MDNLFEPTGRLGAFHRPEAEYQVTIEPATDIDDLLDPEENLERRERSFMLPIAAFVMALAILAFRLVDLQVAQGQVYQGLAKGNRVEVRRLQPPRGIVVDRFGVPLVHNVPMYTLNLYPAQLPKERSDRERIYQTVAEVAGLSQEEVVKQVEKRGLRSLEPIALKSNLDRDTALLWQIKLGFVAGVIIEQVPLRSYEQGLALSHIVGYVGKVTDKELEQRNDLHLRSIVGKAGLELAYDRQLQGREGKEELEVDSKGQIQRVVASEPPQPGSTLELYLDKELQRVLTDALRKGAEKAGRTKAAGIAIDPQTGGILAMVSLPDYDNNLFVQSDKSKERQALFNDKDQPLFNRVIAGLYPPGSTTKPVWAVAGLEEGVITEKTDIQTPSEIRIGQSVFPDWKPHGHADVKKAIAESNNIFFYAIAGGYDRIKGIGPTKMKDYATKFGWNQDSGIDIPGEAIGTYPDPEWKKRRLKESWYIGDTYHMGIGQGYMSLTPLQIVRSISAIANGGTLYEPRLVQAVKDGNDKVVEEPGSKVTAQDIANDNNLRIVREGMRQTVLEGSATPLRDIPMPIAGKTGTAQFEEKDKTHAWFVGFAPFDKPTIAILVMVEGGGGSFEVAVPIAKDVLSWYNDHRYQASMATPE